MGLVSIEEFIMENGKRKLSEVQSKLKQKQIQVHEKMANALDVTPIDIENKQKNEILQKKVLQNSDDLNKLLEMMKEKIQLSPCKIKIQVLTLTPLSWTVRKTAEFFSVSNFMVRTAFRLRREKGILAIQDVKKGQGRRSRQNIGGGLKLSERR